MAMFALTWSLGVISGLIAARDANKWSATLIPSLNETTYKTHLLVNNTPGVGYILRQVATIEEVAITSALTSLFICAAPKTVQNQLAEQHGSFHLAAFRGLSKPVAALILSYMGTARGNRVFGTGDVVSGVTKPLCKFGFQLAGSMLTPTVFGYVNSGSNYLCDSISGVSVVLERRYQQLNIDVSRGTTASEFQSGLRNTTWPQMTSALSESTSRAVVKAAADQLVNDMLWTRLSLGEDINNFLDDVGLSKKGFMGQSVKNSALMVVNSGPVRGAEELATGKTTIETQPFSIKGTDIPLEVPTIDYSSFIPSIDTTTVLASACLAITSAQAWMLSPVVGIPTVALTTLACAVIIANTQEATGQTAQPLGEWEAQ
jgi:hypothetical protein